MDTLTPSEPSKRSKRSTAKRFDVEAGLCSCGSRIVRGEDDDGELVTADVGRTDAARELMARVAGRSSFVISYVAKGESSGLKLKRRSDRDIRSKPAGFNTDAIVLAHDCALTKGTS
jgi:hypothetical protein